MLMIEDILRTAIRHAMGTLLIDGDQIILEHPTEFTHGDYSTNIALTLAKREKTNPRDLAQKIVEMIKQAHGDHHEYVSDIEVAGAGFINFYLKPKFFSETVAHVLENEKDFGKNKILSGKKIMFEYTQPNPFKPFHIGHLMSNAIGESLSRIFEWSGTHVVRANYQGDVGPHVAKAIYILLREPVSKELYTPSQQATYIGECYAKGSQAYDDDVEAKKEIDEINRKVYEKSDAKINEIYDWGRRVTLEAFEEIYKMLGTNFDYYFFESEVAKLGEKIVEEHIGEIFETSDGATVFKAEKFDPKLHTRVFINSKGLPTYETKELGLTKTKFEKEKLDLSVVTTAVEQAEYMKVVEKAVSLMYPEIAQKMKHITHGMMRFATGKMSSRKGNVVTGESLLSDSRAVIFEKIQDREFEEHEKEHLAQVVGVAALKYSILRQAIGGDIIYDFEKSISFEGDSGPYLQYTYTRIQSLLKKGIDRGIIPNTTLPEGWVTTDVEKILYRFPEMNERAFKEYAPHYVATYLIELARAFSTWYGNTKIADENDLHSPYKMALTEAVGVALRNGLWLLGIEAPHKM